MNIIEIILLIFVFLELGNVFTLYFNHTTTLANGMGAFKILQEDLDENVRDITDYLIYWVAGTKVIFMGLLLVIIFLATPVVQFFAVLVMMITTMLYYYKLHPLIKKMDNKDMIQPKGYSRILGILIAVFILAFIIAAALGYSSTFNII
ncbi:MAG: hypothetical protein INQ03_25425 [Candidatus Heimdallarchaeota archaeon]|nr:hypothetical protein [Candidatus Heimdallarchaeota archaeon]